MNITKEDWLREPENPEPVRYESPHPSAPPSVPKYQPLEALAAHASRLHWQTASERAALKQAAKPHRQAAKPMALAATTMRKVAYVQAISRRSQCEAKPATRPTLRRGRSEHRPGLHRSGRASSSSSQDPGDESEPPLAAAQYGECPHPKCDKPRNRGGQHCGRARCEKWVQRKHKAEKVREREQAKIEKRRREAEAYAAAHGRPLRAGPTESELVRKLGCRCGGPSVVGDDGELRCLMCGRLATDGQGHLIEARWPNGDPIVGPRPHDKLGYRVKLIECRMQPGKLGWREDEVVGGPHQVRSNFGTFNQPPQSISGWRGERGSRVEQVRLQEVNKRQREARPRSTHSRAGGERHRLGYESDHSEEAEPVGATP